MRLAEDKIKQAILHPDREVRDVAIRYFSTPTTTDASIMPQAIRALEQFGRRKAFSYNHHLNKLPQTEETVAWCIGELKREFAGTPVDRYFYFMDLSRLLCHADIRLIIPRAPEILHAPGFDPKAKAGFQERLEMLGWDAAKCWAELHRFCEAEKDKPDILQFGFAHASRIVEALARQPHSFNDQILAILTEEPDDIAVWLLPMMANLAGEMKLRAAIPVLVKKLGHEWSMLSDQSMFALAEMGGDDVLEAVCEPILDADLDYRLFASELLGKLHSDGAVQRILEILPDEDDGRVRQNLCNALLNHFSFEGLEPTRQLILESSLDAEVRALRSHLVANATIMEARFPEFERWKEEAAKDALADEPKMKELEEVAYATQGDMKAFVQMMKAKAQKAMPRPLTPAMPRPAAPVSLAQPTRVGRNDPCPCGSGRKYKVCCMRR